MLSAHQQLLYGLSWLAFALKSRRHQPEADTTISVPFGRTAARTAPYRVGQWLWLSARHCSTAHRRVLCDCGLWPSATGFARSRYAAATSSRAEPEPLAFECDVNAAAGERVQRPDAMSWHCRRCSWLVCSLEGLEVALCPPAAAIWAQLARVCAQNTASSARGRHDHFRPPSAAQQRAQRRIEYANGCG